MTTVASTFTQWSTRASPKGGSISDFSAGTGQNDQHRRYSNADARFATLWAPTFNFGRSQLFQFVEADGGTTLTPIIGEASLVGIAGRMDFGIVTQTDPT